MNLCEDAVFLFVTFKKLQKASWVFFSLLYTVSYILHYYMFSNLLIFIRNSFRWNFLTYACNVIYCCLRAQNVLLNSLKIFISCWTDVSRTFLTALSIRAIFQDLKVKCYTIFREIILIDYLITEINIIFFVAKHKITLLNFYRAGVFWIHLRVIEFYRLQQSAHSVHILFFCFFL